MLQVSNIIYRINGKELFNNASLRVSKSQRWGIVGANGIGKSTLFKLITDELHLDSGNIKLQEGIILGSVKQDLPDDDTPLIEIVLQADTERARLINESQTTTNANRIAEIHTRLGDIDAYSAPARAAMILAGLGFSEEDQQRAIRHFSGGWRMRVALASALFRQPDLLLLDEPTNHLDLEAILWLENYLSRYPNTLMVISHDRELLNKVCTHIAHVENSEITNYTGNYDTFERLRFERRAHQQAQREKQQAQRLKMQSFVDRFKAKATKAKQAQSRIKALEKMQIIDAVMADRTVKFTFPKPAQLPPPILALDNVSVGYETDKPILNRLNLTLDMNDRIALLGANGNGKSTLIKLLCGQLKTMQGEIRKSNKLKIGYFSQHQQEELNVNLTPFELMSKELYKETNLEVRARLGKFGFDKDKSDTKIDDLSGGEKARLLFAMMTLNNPHILLLDEPTNHLDMESREALVTALNEFDGAVVMVSHDPCMVERVADNLWIVTDGTCKPYDGDMETYRQLITSQRKQRQANNSNSSNNEIKLSKKQIRQQEAEKRRQFAPLYKQVERCEKLVSKLEIKKQELEQQLASPEIYEDNEKVKDLQFTFGKLNRELDQAEADWIKAQEAYDEAKLEQE